MTFGLQLYLNFNASGKVEAHESFHSLLVGVENIDQSLVGSALELLTGILVLMNSAENGNDFFLGRQRDGAGNGSAVALGGFDDLLGAGVDELMIVSVFGNSIPVTTK